jgi:hypothetical protein
MVRSNPPRQIKTDRTDVAAQLENKVTAESRCEELDNTTG